MKPIFMKTEGKEDRRFYRARNPQISKLKLKLFRKNHKCILVIAFNPKILYMRFLTVQLNVKH